MEAIIGVVIVISALVVLTILTVYSRGKINRLADQDFPNARDANKLSRDGE